MIIFTHGVASGDPTDEGAVLWTRALDEDSPLQTVQLTCVVAQDDTGREQVRTIAHCDPHRDSTVHVCVDGLAPGENYSYWFEAGGSRSRLGHFRTLAKDGRELKFAVVSCAKFNAGYFNAYRCIAERSELAFVLHLGDYIYEAANIPPRSQTPGANIGRDFDPLHECCTLEDYRRRYAQYRSDPDLQDLHAAHAIIATIDDHEIADNAWSGGAEEHREDEHGPWANRVTNALTAWEDWMPTLCRPTQGDVIYRSIRFGSLATVVVLDTRLNRSNIGETDPLLRSQLGDKQLAWLSALAAESSANWLVIGIPSTLAPLWSHSHDDVAVHALRTLKVAAMDLRSGHYDLWDAFPNERERLLEAIDSSASSCLLLSGDIHVSLAADIRREGRGVAVEWTTPSLTSQNLDDKMGWAPRTMSLAAEDSVMRSLPHIRFCNFDDHGYLLVTLDECEAKGEWWFVDSVRERRETERSGHSESVLIEYPAERAGF